MKRAAALWTCTALVLLGSCHAPPRRLALGVALAQSNHPAIAIALAELNGGGGLAGRSLEPLGLDRPFSDDDDPEPRLAWAEAMAADPSVLAVIGHSDSAATLSTAPIYQAAGLPQLVTVATHPAIVEMGTWTYRLCLPDDVQGRLLARHAIADWGKRRVALFYVNDDYGRGLAEAFERAARDLGAAPVAAIPVPQQLDDDQRETLRLAIRRLAREDPPDLFVLFQRVASGGETIREIRAAGLSTDILGGDNLGLRWPRDWSALLEGARTAQFVTASSDDRDAARFADAFRQATGRDPDYSDAFAYDAVRLLVLAERLGGPTRRGIKNGLDRLIRERKEIHGVAGAYRLGQDRDAVRPLRIVEWHDGAPTIVATFDHEG